MQPDSKKSIMRDERRRRAKKKTTALQRYVKHYRVKQMRSYVRDNIRISVRVCEM